MSDPIVPARILEIEAQWQAWLAVFTATLQVKQDALPYKIKTLFRHGPDEAARYAVSLLEHVINASAECLSISGALSLSLWKYADRFAFDGYSMPTHIAADPLGWARTVSPVAIYRAIASEHPANVVRDIESTSLATSVVRRFGLGGHSPIVQRAGWIVLSLTAASTASSTGKFSYSSHWAEGLHEDVRSVARILVGLLDFDGDLDELRMPLSSALLGNGHVSRERIAVTDDIGLVLYKNKVEVLLSPKAGAALNAFLGEWAPSAEAA